MTHCVGSYAKDVEKGRNDIYSLRGPQDKLTLTVEAHGTTLAHLKGFANGRCPAELRETAGGFARVFEKYDIKISPSTSERKFRRSSESWLQTHGGSA